MKIELDMQEREFIKMWAKQMFALIRRDIAPNGRNVTGADAASMAFYERLAQKMEGDGGPAPR